MKTHTETTRVLHVFRPNDMLGTEEFAGNVELSERHKVKNLADAHVAFGYSRGTKRFTSARIETITRRVTETRTTKEIRK